MLDPFSEMYLAFATLYPCRKKTSSSLNGKEADTWKVLKDSWEASSASPSK